MNIRQWLSGKPVDEIFDLQTVRKQLLDQITVISVLLGLAAYLVSLFLAMQSQSTFEVWLYTLAYLWILVITFSRKLPYLLRAHSFLAIFYVLGIVGLLESGLSGNGRILLMAYSILVVVFIGARSAIGSLVLNLAAFVVVGFGMSAGWIPTPPIELQANSTRILDWISALLIFAIFTTIASSSLLTIFQGMKEAKERQKKLAEEIDLNHQDLKNQVAERSQELQKQTAQMEAVGEIAREISGETNLDALLNRTTELIQSNFGYDHAGIFLVDTANEYAVLRAAGSVGGRRMIEQGHRLRIGAEGIVGSVVEKGLARIALDVDEDSAHWKNPSLPDTRSEMALPLKSGDRVIGALDIQSSLSAAFKPEDSKILQIIANQVAVAIEKLSLFEQLQKANAEFEANSKRSTYREWQSHLGATRKAHAYRFQEGELKNEVDLSPEAQDALLQGKPVVRTLQNPESKEMESAVAVPIQLRGQTLGVLNVRFSNATVPAEVIRMVQAATERMALSLETARLLEEVQIRADREHLVSDISTKVRSASDIDNVLRTTALELGRSFGLSEVVVQLRSKETN